LIFLGGLFQKNPGWIFLVRSNYMNPIDNYGRLLDFLSQISERSYFNVGLLDLADFMMHR